MPLALPTEAGALLRGLAATVSDASRAGARARARRPAPARGGGSGDRLVMTLAGSRRGTPPSRPPGARGDVGRPAAPRRRRERRQEVGGRFVGALAPRSRSASARSCASTTRGRRSGSSGSTAPARRSPVAERPSQDAEAKLSAPTGAISPNQSNDLLIARRRGSSLARPLDGLVRARPSGTMSALPREKRPMLTTRAVSPRRRALALAASRSLLVLLLPAAARAQGNADCLGCHGQKGFTTERKGRTVSLYVPEKALRRARSTAASQCVNCHADLQGKELPHDAPLRKVDCGACHDAEAKQHAASLHGQAMKRGDPLAPALRRLPRHARHPRRRRTRARRSRRSRCPFTCGKCHQEGTVGPAAARRSTRTTSSRTTRRSIHGEGLLKKGLVVAANCASCHTAHNILPHTDPASSIARGEHREDLHEVPRADRAGAPQGDQGRAVGEGGARAAGVRRLPPAAQGAEGLLRPGHGRRRLPASATARRAQGATDGRSLFVDAAEVAAARATRRSPAAQCHSGVNASRAAAVRDDHAEGRLRLVPHRGRASSTRAAATASCSRRRPERPVVQGVPRHARDRSARLPGVLADVPDATCPQLCARCHREGEKAARALQGAAARDHRAYTESIHGKGLLKSGLTVTATCTSCHTAHGVLPAHGPRVERQPRERARRPAARATTASRSSSSRASTTTLVGKTDKELPVCNDCHSAHTIRRADATGFKLDIMHEVRPLPRARSRRPTSTPTTARSASSATRRPRSATTATARTTSCRSPTRARTSRRENVVADLPEVPRRARRGASPAT